MINIIVQYWYLSLWKKEIKVKKLVKKKNATIRDLFL